MGRFSSQLSNGSALVIATLFNTAANRSWTFGVTGRHRVVTHHGQALVIFGITYAATTLALALLDGVAPNASAFAQTAVLAVANLLSTVVRFVAMKRWIFTTPRAEERGTLEQAQRHTASSLDAS